MKYDLIVFDWDGTILDSAGAIARAIQLAAVDIGFPKPEEDCCRYVIGMALKEALHHVIPSQSAEDYDRFVDRYRHHYLQQDKQLVIFDGIHELLARLHEAGYPLAVATGKSRLGLERAFDHANLRHFFGDSRCADECHGKPHPQMLEELMAAFGVSPDKTIMIGDTTHDMDMAKNAGTAGLAVSYGAHSAASLQKSEPLAILKNVAALNDWLRENA